MPWRAGRIEHDEACLVLHSWRIAVAGSYLGGTELWLNFVRYIGYVLVRIWPCPQSVWPWELSESVANVVRSVRSFHVMVFSVKLVKKESIIILRAAVHGVETHFIANRYEIQAYHFSSEDHAHSVLGQKMHSACGLLASRLHSEPRCLLRRT